MLKLKKCIISFFIPIIILSLPYFSYSQEDLDNAIVKLADKISQHMADKRKTKIAVIPFQDLKTDRVTTLGKYISEELTTALFNSGKFNIIERNLLEKVLDELKLSQTGAINPSSAKELGKITGVDAVVTGTIQDLVNRVAINCRLIETETGNIFAAASEKVLKDQAISKLLEEVIEEKPKTEEKKGEEEEIKGPLTYDASDYFLSGIMGTSGGLFSIEFITVTIDQSVVIKVFFVNPFNYGASWLFSLPTITDDRGNSYSITKFAGNFKEKRYMEKKYFLIKMPGDGKVPASFEFPLIPKTVNKIWFSLNDKSKEIDWQNILSKRIK